MVEFDRTAFIGKFQEEAGEYLQRLNEGVITLEAEPGNKFLIEQMLRDAHTLKGSSRMVGLIEISDVAHKLEDIMVAIRDGALMYEASMSDAFFEALDLIVYLSEHAGEEIGADIDVAGLCSRLEAIAATGASPPAPVAEPAAASETAVEPEPVKAPEEPPAAREPATRQKPAHEDELKAREQATIRVRSAQLDALLNLTSEVVIAQIKSEQRTLEMRALQAEQVDLRQLLMRVRATLSTLDAGDEQSSLLSDLDLLDGDLADHGRHVAQVVKEYADDVSRTSTVVADLQENGMRLRMLPVATVFDRFPRAMRDLARQYNKDVDFIIEGADTELDKKVLEEIHDPLIHILRNAVDHGLEDADARVAAGKLEKGSIRMVARQEGDHIVVEVSDDGAGIDPTRVRESAVRKGYITEGEARNMSDREATYLIFESGFSTAAIITEVSGRGVGMDVVRQFVVEKLKGQMDVESEMGRGTTFRLRIPLTLAIIRALILRVGGHLFAIPTGSIEETLRMSPDEVIKVEGREVVRRQRRNVPVVRMGDVIGVAHAETPPAKTPVVIVGFSGHRMGFMVDAFQGEQQIVIKTLGSHLKKVENVAGVTILGAGEVVLILSVPELMSNARSMAAMRVSEAKAEEQKGPKRILICEDSFTTRELERSIFEAAGFDVEVATDGAQGLRRMKEGLSVDAVVTDVQMPNLDGFQLTKAIKTDPALKDTPVIIVTSLERDEEKAIGIEVGADAYITKSVFNQDTLLDTVDRLIR